VSPTETIAAGRPKEYVKLEWAATLVVGGGLAHSNHCTVVFLVSHYSIYQFFFHLALFLKNKNMTFFFKL
jgi:hypothetical protein